MDLVEWVLVPAIKRPAGASNEVGYAQTDDDRHQRGDELETAHEILRVLHDGPSLFGIGLGNRATKWEFPHARAGERRLPACESRQLAQAGASSRYLKKLHVQRCCRQGCRQLHASSLCSPEIRETRALPNHYNAGSKIFFANSQSIPRLKSASAVPSIGSL